MEKNKVSKSVSEMFSTARIYCLISIIAAHMYFPNSFAEVFLGKLGTLGVVLLLIISGYFYRPKKFDSVCFLLKKKFVSIGIPWLFLGSVVWLYNVIASEQFRSVTGYFNWIIGNGTYLYYMPILLICFLMFYKSHNVTLISALVLNAAFIVLTAFGLMNKVVSFFGINHYLNPFNWIGFFALGMILQQIDAEKLFNFFRKFRFLNVVLFVIAFVILLIFTNVKSDYFSLVAIPYELLGSLAILSLSTFNLTKYKIFKKLSAYTFCIYLIHMIFIGLLDSFLSMHILLMYFSPLVIMCFAFLVISVVEWFANKMKFRRIFCLAFGIRDIK